MELLPVETPVLPREVGVLLEPDVPVVVLPGVVVVVDCEVLAAVEAPATFLPLPFEPAQPPTPNAMTATSAATKTRFIREPSFAVSPVSLELGTSSHSRRSNHRAHARSRVTDYLKTA
jgi:hypothetical protein